MRVYLAASDLRASTTNRCPMKPSSPAAKARSHWRAERRETEEREEPKAAEENRPTQMPKEPPTNVIRKASTCCEMNRNKRHMCLQNYTPKKVITLTPLVNVTSQA